jgi:hypothetical protein
LLWLLAPIAGLVELGAHLYFAGRAPRETDFAELKSEVERLRNTGELVVIAPEWAEPLARKAFGEELMPLADVARSDATGYERALEIGMLDQRSPELSGWTELAEERDGPFLLRTLKNPHYEAVRYAFNEHVRPSELFVVEWNGEAEHNCDFTPRARVTAGGLGGHVAYPAERFRCSGGEAYFAGVTLIDDQRYRPRRCLYAHPPVNAVLHLRFPNVPAGKKLRGYGGQSFLLTRDGNAAPIEFAIFIDGHEIGRRDFLDQQGFSPFEFAIGRGAPERVEVTFQVQSKSPVGREFCFAAEMR